jgi:hypothetical protein
MSVIGEFEPAGMANGAFPSAVLGPWAPDLVQRVVGFRLTARCAAASVEAW